VRLLTSLATAAAAQIEVGIVSERHQAAAERYRALLDSMPETVILVLDEQLRFQVASGEALTRSGYDPVALIGKRLADTIPEASRWALAHYEAGLAGHHHEFLLTNAAGVTYAVEIVPVRDRDGQVRSVMALSREAAQAA
jgi:PAS domain S-box-containing protein